MTPRFASVCLATCRRDDASRPKRDASVQASCLAMGLSPGVCRDWWDDPDYHVQLRAEAEAAEDCLVARALWLGALPRLERGPAATPGPVHPASAAPSTSCESPS